MNDKKDAIELRIAGLVQGVGFRPFIYRLANELKLTGTVRNQTDGVFVHLEGPAAALRAFQTRLRSEAPPASAIDEIQVSNPQPGGAQGFVIVQSADASTAVTRISPDLPVCDDCLADMRDAAQPNDRRRDYPFTNCTNCGPRFSIVTALPYDRPLTTMGLFEMCDECRAEYGDVTDRRFHAQPVACRQCGPRYQVAASISELADFARSTAAESTPDGRADSAAIADSLAAALDGGAIVAMKGIGGFHLACDATNQSSVAELRSRKHREAKPFAVMFESAQEVARYASVSESERELLESPARPIVLLQTRGVTTPALSLAHAVSNGLHTIGAILPYMPMHHLVFDRLQTPAIVLTSGNRSSEPIVIDNDRAGETLGSVADLLLTHNRDIHNRQDDSVAMIVAGKTRLMRRSRGYVPAPVRLAFRADGIVAVGAEQKNTLCFGSGSEALVSQHIGDLHDSATLAFFEEVLDRFPSIFRITPRLVVRDNHPDYLSGETAERLGLPVVSVGHHHAHIASCMAEHGVNGRVIGIALDGTGYGDDEAIWGGEFLIADLRGYDRFAHFSYIPLPGGDLAVDEPWRSGLSYLTSVFGPEGPSESIRSALPIYDDEVVAPKERAAVLHALASGINTPPTSSAGRLFDAVAALCGVCLRSGFDAEAPMRLADCLTSGVEDSYEFDIVAPGSDLSSGTDAPRLVRFDSMIRQICRDVAAHLPVGLISARFHNTICEVAVVVAREARDVHGINRVVLSGGVFQNSYLLARCEHKLGAAGFEVYSHEKVPSNDGGISLGQLAVAAAREHG